MSSHSDCVVLWVPLQDLTFGADTGTSTISGYKKQLFSGGLAARVYTVQAVRPLMEELLQEMNAQL